MAPVRYVQAVYDFTPTEREDISFSAGDILQVFSQLDDNWLIGKNLMKFEQNIGNFPAEFVEPFVIPAVGADEHVFVAKSYFSSDVDGDLSFQKGDIIVGLEAVDENWWQGQIGRSFGIFPLTHVIVLGNVAGQPQTGGELSSTASIGQSSNVAVNDCDDSSQSCNTSKVNGKLKENENITVFARARALSDLSAQLDEELSFKAGDIIDITEVTDIDFAVGRCANGHVGQFPLGFVQVFEGSINSFISAAPNTRSKPKFDWWKDPNAAADILNKHQKVESSCSRPSFEQQTAPIVPDDFSFGYSQQSAVIQPAGVEETPSTDWSNVFLPGSRVRAVFQFVAENENELPLLPGDIVCIKRVVDSQWIEGEINGSRGIFPSSFVVICNDDRVPDVRSVLTQNLEKLGDLIYDVHDEATASTIAQLNTLSISSDHPIVYSDCNSDDTVFVEMSASNHGGHIEVTEDVADMDVLTYPTDLSSNADGSDISTYLATDNKDTFEVERQQQERSALTSVGKSPAYETEEPSDDAEKSSLEATNSNCISKSNASKEKPAVAPKKLALKPEPSRPKPQLKPKPSLAVQPHTDVKFACVEQMPVDTKPTESIKPPVAKRPSVPVKSTKNGGSSAFVRSSSECSLKPISELERLDISEEGRTSDGQPLSKNEMEFKVDSALNSIPVQAPKPSARHALRLSSNGDRPPRSVSFDDGITTFIFDDATENSNRSEGRQLGNSIFYSDLIGLDILPEKVSNKIVHISQTGSIDGRDSSHHSLCPPKRPAAPIRSVSDVSSQRSLEAKPVPCRPAPPRPAAVSLRETVSLCFGHSSESENVEVVNDLKRRIGEIDKDLEAYWEAKLKLEKQSTNSNHDEDVSYSNENIEFYDANIDGLTAERKQLVESLSLLVPKRPNRSVDQSSTTAPLTAQQFAEEQARKQQMADLKNKRRDTREKVIVELLQTENEYLQSLCLCLEVFFDPTSRKAPPQVDLEFLFGNMVDVVDLSQRVLTYFETNIVGKSFEEQIVGVCFTELKEDLKKVYSVYCRNHDEVIALLDKYESSPEAQEYFNSQLDVMRSQKETVFDLGSILIRPVQRILKYPLLLNELVKSTEVEHADYIHVTAAVQVMTEVAVAINEFKRRKDLVFKYKKTTVVSFSELLSKFNVHSTKKKITRLSMMLVGVQTTDENFDSEERKFKALEECVSTLVNDISLYLVKLKEALCYLENVACNISELYGDQATNYGIEKLCSSCRWLAFGRYNALKTEVETNVLPPLNNLILAFQGPIKVMKKRYDKLLDFDSANIRLKNTRDAEQTKWMRDDVQKKKVNYEAMNEQLLEDLPQLYNLSLSVVTDCLCRLLRLLTLFHAEASETVTRLGQLPSQRLASTDTDRIIEQFQQANNIAIEQLQGLLLIPRVFFQGVCDDRINPSPLRDRRSMEPPEVAVGSKPLTSGASRLVLQRYPASSLCELTQDVFGSQDMDLQLTKGSIVAVIKEGDPTGNKERYFVDSGVQKGFVARRYLTPHASDPGNADKEALSGEKVTYGELICQASSPNERSNMSATSSPSSPLSGSDNTLQAAAPSDQKFPSEKSPTFASSVVNSRSSIASSERTSTGYQNYLTTPQSEENSRVTPSPVAEKKFFNSQPKANSRVFDEQRLSQQFSHLYAATNIELFQAIYPYTASSNLELTLHEGQVVNVMSKKDLTGNAEWWLVSSADGRQGYVPANYLYQLH